jgi:DNA-binding IclR family transcriptional regulator
MRVDQTGIDTSDTPFEGNALNALLLRIRAEYEDMPGLCLTLRQAARLWDLEPKMCERLLETLVSQGVLRQGRGGYLLARSGARA